MELCLNDAETASGGSAASEKCGPTTTQFASPLLVLTIEVRIILLAGSRARCMSLCTASIHWNIRVLNITADCAFTWFKIRSIPEHALRSSDRAGSFGSMYQGC